MSRLGTRFCIFPAMLFLCGMSSCPGTLVPNTEDLTIFHTNDLHSHLRAEKADPFGLGGLARLSTLLKELRENSGGSITLDAGDWSEGTWYYSVDLGANMLRFLKLMNYDAACLGNHDFLNGPDQIIKTITAANPPFPVLAANLDTAGYPNTGNFDKILFPYLIKQVKDLKVGIIGLTTFEIFYAGFMSPIKITNPIDAATAIAKKLRPDVDVLIILSHNSFDKNLELAASVPGIDAVISGHSHKKVSNAKLVDNDGRKIPVVETGAFGKFLGELKLTFDKTTRSVKFKSYQLHPVSPDITEDPQVSEEVANQDLLLNQKFNEKVDRDVTTADFDFLQNSESESTLGNFVAKAYRAGTGADVSLEELSYTGSDIAKGPVSLMDLHDVSPHIYNPASGKEWDIEIWNAKGLDLNTVITAFYTINGLMPLSSPIGWLSVDNAKIQWDPSFRNSGQSLTDIINTGAPFQLFPSVKQILIGNQLLDPTKHYRVAMSDGLLLAIKTFVQITHMNLDFSDVKDTGTEAWRSLLSYGSKPSSLSLENLKIGENVSTVGADLAIYYYDLNWDGKSVSVRVLNRGLVASSPQSSMECQFGSPNDLALYGTDDQMWSSIGTVPIPIIQPAGYVDLQIPWDSSNLELGYWPVQCLVSSDSDSYPANNIASNVFKVGQ